MIIGIVVAISVIIAFIFTIYFCRCCKWSHDTNDIFKDVDKDIVVNYKEAVPVKPTANGKDIKDRVKIYRGFSPYATFGTWKKFALTKNRISKIFVLCTQ